MTKRHMILYGLCAFIIAVFGYSFWINAAH